MPHTLQEKKKVTLRLRRIRGQAEGLERAIEAGTECSHLLQQLSAMRGAINGLMAEIFESHLRETLKQANNKGHRPSAAQQANIDTLALLVRSYLK